jgi:hypothetical protein
MAALTLVEFLVVVAMLTAIAVLLLPSMLPRRFERAARVSCVYNLKGIGVAFKTWTVDNNDKPPMLVSVTNGGTMELVSSTNAFVHFQAMSNELSTPKLLFCPDEADKNRRPATTFRDSIPTGALNQVAFSDLSISYFLNVSDNTNLLSSPDLFLCGDRTISINRVLAKHGLHPVSTNDFLRWDLKSGHKGYGNILIADGSVQQTDTRLLNSIFAQTGLATNYLMFP